MSLKEEEKKAVMLLKSLILHYHGLDEDEKKILERAATGIDAAKDLVWANGFIAEDYLSAFERSREYLKKILLQWPEAQRLGALVEIWEENYEKGYVTEMETTAMFNLAKDWGVEKGFLQKVGK